MKQQRALLLLLLSILKLRVHRQNVNIYQHDAKLHSAASMQSTDRERERDSHISFEIVTNNIENQMQQLTTEKREVQLMFIKHNHF